MHKLSQWLKNSTYPERQMMAELAGTSLPHLGHVASHRRRCSPELAGRIADACEAIRMREEQPVARLPRVTRGDLAPICAGCPYFQNFEGIED